MKANIEQCNIMRLFALSDSQGVINNKILFPVIEFLQILNSQKEA